MRLTSCVRPRRGAVTIFIVILVLALCCLVALGVDVGYMAAVRNEMQNAADTSALAATEQLMSRELLQGGTTPTDGMAAARTKAVTIAGLNKGGGTYLTLDRNDANASDGDIVIGYLADPSNASESISFATQPYNSVQVLVHRDDVRNGPLNLFFSSIMGQNSQEMQIKATATVEGQIRGFKIRTGGPTTSKLIPFALNINTWNDQVINGNGPDAWSYNPDTNAYIAGSDSIHEVKLFPNHGDSSGNFGTIDIGASDNSAAVLHRQIQDGPNASDFAYYSEGEFKLNDQGYIMTTGDTGISATLKASIEAIRGQPRILPLFEPPLTGSGDNAQYKIVAFVGVVITDVNLNGSQSTKQLTIQPEYCIDATGIGGGTTTSSKFVYKGVAITR